MILPSNDKNLLSIEQCYVKSYNNIVYIHEVLDNLQIDNKEIFEIINNNLKFK